MEKEAAIKGQAIVIITHEDFEAMLHGMGCDEGRIVSVEYDCKRRVWKILLEKEIEDEPAKSL